MNEGGGGCLGGWFQASRSTEKHRSAQKGERTTGRRIDHESIGDGLSEGQLSEGKKKCRWKGFR